MADKPRSFVNVIFYFNREENYFRYPLDEATASVRRPVPERMYLILEGPDGVIRYPMFNFNENEIVIEFKRLSLNATTQ